MQRKDKTLAEGTLPPKLVQVDRRQDDRGVLKVLESPALPFAPQRVFVVTSAPVGQVRGGHGHMACDQLLMAILGTVRVTVNPTNAPSSFTLTPDGQALLLPAGNWASQTYLSEGATLLVLASTVYDPRDYFTDSTIAPL